MWDREVKRRRQLDLIRCQEMNNMVYRKKKPPRRQLSFGCSDGNIRLPVIRVRGYHDDYFERDQHPGPPDRKYFTTKMEAEYVGYYLGSSMLTKGTTGLGVIQKPLREKYFAFRKSSDNRLGPEIGIRVNPAGLSLLFPGSHPGEPNDGFYDISSIHFIEAIRFVVVKEKDKKFYGAFLPIDEGSAANASKEKLFQQIDKKMSHLTKVTHPAMLTCVMRRPTGVKAVDCHMFVIPVVEDALQIADMVHRFQDRPVHPDYGRGGPIQSPRGRPEMYPNPDVVPRDPRDVGLRDSNKRASNEEYELYRGPGRGFELKQEHFRQNDLSDRRSGGPEFDRRSGGPEFDKRPGGLEFENNRSFERDRQFNDETRRNEYNEERNRFHRQGDDFVERRPPREGRSSDGYVERDSLGQEYEFDNAPPPDRRFGGEMDRGRINSDRANASPRDIRRFDRHSDSLMRYGDRPLEASRGQAWNREPREEYPPRRNMSGDDLYSRPLRTGPGGPRARSPPRAVSPPRGHSSPRSPRSPRSRSPAGTDEIYSASNLESRLETETSGKPIAKVPPHRQGGVRVLPSLPLPGAKNQLKPVSPRPTDPPKDQKEKAPTYNFEPDNDRYNEDDDMENPYDNAPLKGNTPRQGRVYSDQPQEVERRGEDIYRDANRVKSDGYSYTGYDVNENQRNSGKAPTYASNAAAVRPWSFDEEKEKFMRQKEQERQGWNSGYKAKSAHEIQERDYGAQYSERQTNDAKDGEMEQMFSNLRTGNKARTDVDFERTLGYLP